MPFIPAADTAMVEVRMLLDAQRVENTLYFRRDTGWDAISMAELGAQLLLWWTEHWRVQISSGVTLREIYITDQSAEDGIVHTQPAPVPAPAGSQNLEPVPNNVALCVSFRTALRGRSYRGRNYVPGIPRDNVNSNDVSPGAAAGVVAAYNELFDVAEGLGVFWSVVSRYHNKAPRTAAAVVNVSSVVLVDPTVDSQRRRLPGRGK